MAFILLATCLLITVSAVTAECDACFDGNCYKKTSIFAGLQLSGQMAIDRSSNTLYFHFLDSQDLDYNAVFDLDFLDFQLMHDLGFTFAHAVDQSKKDVFLSVIRGVLKFNRNTTVTENYGLGDKTIWHLQFKDKLYYVKYHENGIFTYENDKSKAVRQDVLENYRIDEFVVDKNDDIYFLSDNTVYQLTHDSDDVTIIANALYTLSIDKNGEVYFVKPYEKSLYRLDSSNDLSKVGIIGNGIPFKAVFDRNNNVIYEDIETNRLYYLTRDVNRCRIVKSKYNMLEIEIVQ